MKLPSVYPTVKSKFSRRFLKEVEITEKQRAGDSPKEDELSYRPEGAEKQLIHRIMAAYNVGEENLNRPLKVFSNRSVLEVDERAHEILDIYKPEIEKTIEDAWKSDVRRPISRNKVIAVVAHQLNKLIIPSVKAQTPGQEHDELAAQVMRDILDYIRYKVKYRDEMMYALIEATASPLTVMETGYATLYKQLKQEGEDGVHTIEMVIDSYLTGFYLARHNITEILIPSMGEKNIQRQEWVIRRKLISIDTARARWGNEENFKFVQAGVYTKLNSNSKFYEDTSDSLLNNGELKLVDEVVFQSRFTDTYAVMVNGVLVTDIDEGINRSDGLINMATLGYEPITREAGFYHYPFILKLTEDQTLLEDMYNITMDGAKLDVLPPTAVTQAIGGANVVPGASVVVREGFEAKPLAGGRNTSAGFQAIQLVESSFESVSPSARVGVPSPGEKTRREVELLDANAETAQALFKSQFESFVTELTQLFIGDAQDYITAPALRKLISGISVDTILIPDAFQQGSPISKEIKFVSPLSSRADSLDRSYRLLEKEKDTKKRIAEVNPLTYLDIKFSAYMQPEQVSAQNPVRNEQVARELYILLKDNPTVDVDALTRNFISVYAPYKVDKLMKDPAILKQMMQQAAQPPQQTGPGQPAPGQPVPPQPGPGMPTNTPSIPSVGGADNAPVRKPGMPVG